MSAATRRRIAIVGRMRRQSSVLVMGTAFLIIAGLYAIDVGRFIINSAPALTTIEANVEWVEAVEAAPLRNQILLSPALVSTDSHPEGRCLRGVLLPTAGSQLRLSRQGSRAPLLEILPAPDGTAARFEGAQGQPVFREAITVRFGGAKDPCHDQRDLIRIPIFGAATLGTDYSAEADPDSPALLLRSGRVQTFAAVTPTFLSRTLDAFRGASGSELFPVGSVELPAGARVRECAPGAKRVPWSGWAEVKRETPDVSDRNISVVAYTDAEQIALATPGGSRTGGSVCDPATQGENDAMGGVSAREDVIGVSLLSRIAGDPNIAAESLLVGFAVLALQVLISLVDMKRSTGDAA